MRYMDRTVIGLSIAFLILLAAAFFMPEWVRFIGLQSLARGTVALGLLVLWRSGLVSFGHALYFGVGAYAAAMLTLVGYHDAFFLVFAGTLAAGLLAFILGFLLRRYRGIFFALLNMAFSMILYGAIVKTEALGSTDGFNVLTPTFLGYAPEGEAVQTTLFIYTLVFTFFITVGVSVPFSTLFRLRFNVFSSGILQVVLRALELNWNMLGVDGQARNSRSVHRER